LGDVARAFVSAAIGGVLGLTIAGPIGLICGLALGAAYGIGEGH
jgi:hypothetical protein